MQGTKKTEITEEPLEVAILDLKRETRDSFELVKIYTSRGRIDCHYYRAEKADKGVILVGGIGGGFDTPAEDLYPRLCADLKEAGISSLRVSFRYPTDLTEAVVDVLVGLGFLKAENLRGFGLIGHSFGGAVVVQAAFNDRSVKTVVTLATQSYGISPISLLPESTSVLLIHGEADETLPPRSSVYAYNMAHEPKRIKIYESAGHGLKEVSDEVYAEVRNWIVDNLK
ncbi:alpha/beta hydrolase family protein [Methanosarcina sp.]|uniref:alpha/beta hydrolase family protein n=1 Tax=Methanosarcina sp. TaxID=2213 RepID=UPI003C73E44F